MKTQTSILFYLRKSRENKKGEMPVYMRITVEGRRIDFTINRFIHPDKWSTEAANMKGNSEEARTFNTYLSTLAALTHQRFVYIQPFIDGNGRMARLLMNLALLRND